MMADKSSNSGNHGPRKSLLELAPLELDCMNALWPMGEGTVREIREELAARRPRAYTTIMTIMDRLAHKGVVARRKVGRAYLYRPNLSAAEARSHALGQVVEGFFGGSSQALVEQLQTGEIHTPLSVQIPESQAWSRHRPVPETRRARTAPAVKSEPELEQKIPPSRLDDTLL